MTIDVYMKLTTGRVFHMPVSENETIRELCERVAVEEGVPGNCLRFKYTGKVLNKDYTIGYLGVRPETILKADIIKPKSLTVHVQCPSGDTITLVIQNVTELKEIMLRIKDRREKLGQYDPQINTRLQLNGKNLVGENNIAQDLGIVDESSLKLVEQAPAGDPVAVPPEEDLDQAALDELMATFAEGFGTDQDVEVVFSFDTTGSMYGSLTEVRSKLDQTVTRLLRDIPKIRIGIMSHGDFCDYETYVVRSIDLTSNLEELLEYINNVPRTGGEGPNACYEWVLHKAHDLSWSEDAAKALVIIGDVKPHEVSFTDQHINWHDELDRLCQREIKVYGVQVYDQTEFTPFYKELAEKSRGAYIKFAHFNCLTDMFLAVCYREAGEAQLQQYAEEVTQDGRMTEELTDMFKQLKDKPSTTEDEIEKKEETAEAGAAEETKKGNYVALPWWDPKLDESKVPVFTYCSETDVWKRKPVVYRQGYNDGPRKRRGIKRCVVM
ncbi:uncharacterized protein LOC117296009 [Asterias rubens]|uniref:uncharacterized protein LOC117296009 n=1 Tax=Asterias rubens TaxID=7604 RepID=UPI001454E99A|nr:uncharacterized protein LOC117296009 [Asterias rubens]